MITLRNESAAQLVNVLRPLITPNNTIAAFPATNALIITDYAENLRRIEKIIASLDQPPSGEPIVVTLKYASALDLVPLVNRLLGAEIGNGARRPARRSAAARHDRRRSALEQRDAAFRESGARRAGQGA